MQVVIDELIAGRMMVPDQTVQPHYIVLATDGEPNELCANPSGRDPRTEVIDQVKRAADAGAERAAERCSTRQNIVPQCVGGVTH
jgi:hypothetical protein